MTRERAPYDPSHSLARKAMDKCDYLNYELDELKRLMIKLSHESAKQSRTIIAGTLCLSFTVFIFACTVTLSFFN